jgi:hypothetical protein
MNCGEKSGEEELRLITKNILELEKSPERSG